MPANLDQNGKARAALLLMVLLTAIIQFLPYEYSRWVAWPLMLFSTFAHEMGHGIAAIFAGGEFHSFKMWANGSGVASTSHAGSAFGRAFISAGGLIGPAILGAILFFLGRREKLARIGLYSLGGLLLLSDLLVVRNPFGLIFVGIVGLTCLLIAFKTSETTARFFIIFLAVQLAFSVYSRGDYLFTDTAQTTAGTMPSDVAQIANALFPPYWLWGLICGGFSLLVVLVGVWPYLRGERKKAALPK